MRAWAVGPAAVILLSTAGSLAQGEHKRLAFVGSDATLERSTTIALTPWAIDVSPLDVPTPPAPIADATRTARAIAVSSRVDAVAWLVEGEGTRTLMVYDARADQVVSREVATGPIDEPVAAAITLSLKTLLRTSTVAPPTERVGAPEQAPEEGIGALRLEGDAGFRMRTDDGKARLDPRFGLAIAWWPRPLHRWLGVALRLEEGTGISARGEEFTGRLTDHAAALSLRSQIRLSSRFSLEPAAGFALHLTLLDGASVDGVPASNLTRLDPAVEASLLFGAALGHGVTLGLRGGFSFWIRSQEYDVDNTVPTLTLPAVQENFGLVIGAALN